MMESGIFKTISDYLGSECPMNESNAQPRALDSQNCKHEVLVITGPTATGKSAFGAALAMALGGEVVSADSMQIYKYMDIGTAKPTSEERLGVPHHMLDIVLPWEDYSVARYVSEAAKCVDNIHRRGKTPILVGGSGLYIDSLLSGREFSARSDETLRRELITEYDEVGGESMLLKLHKFDPESAAKLHPNDKKRIMRAFEVYRTTGKTISQHDMETRSLPPRYIAEKFALTFSDRKELYSRIDTRVETMLEKGLLNEVRGLLDMGVPPDCTAMQAIGYKEMVDVVLGTCSLDAASDKVKMESRRYAKRQLTWLRRDTSIEWIVWDNGKTCSPIKNS